LTSKSLAKPTSGAIRRRLADRLFADSLPFLLALLTCDTAIGALIVLRTDDRWLLAGGFAAVATRLVQIAVTASAKRQVPLSTRAAQLWLQRWSVLGCTYAACVGFIAFRGFAYSNDGLVHLLAGLLAVITASAVARSAGRPRMVVAQLLLLLAPLLTAVTLTEDPAYWSLLLPGVSFLALNVRSALDIYRRAAGEEVALQSRERLSLRLSRQNAVLQQRDAELATQVARFSAALEHMAQGLVMFDADLRLTVVNERYLQIYSLSADVVKPGISLRDLVAHSVAIGNHPGRTVDEQLNNYVDHIRRCEIGTLERVLGDGRIIEVHHRPLSGGGYVATVEDITAQRQAEELVQRMARHDALTGLPNRVLLRERLSAALARAKAGAGFALLCLDLDRFKPVNDTLGHAIGDELLRQVAERLTAHTRDGDSAARLGGDELAVLATKCASSAEASQLAERLLHELSRPYAVQGHSIIIGATIGIAFAPSDGLDPDTLLQRADMALYRAKEAGRGSFTFYEPAMDRRLQQRHRLESELRRAVDDGSFELHYQPIKLVHGDVSGFEALLRWPCPGRGLVAAHEFIWLAEEIGLITRLGSWVLAQACREAMSWPRPLRVAVNVSSMQFRDGSLVGAVRAALEGSGLEPGRLELEITETVLLQENESTLAILHELRAMGVRIAMDDFGTGYSSLNYLRSFPFDRIKIDRAFVQDIATSDDSQAIVVAVANLSRSLGLETTVEGIETEDQLRLIQAAGCHEVQGFLISRPQPAAAIPGLLASQVVRAN
jgi:diguanylate cyclase (GGDEF)-like protein